MPVLLPPVHELDAEPALRFGDRELSYRELRDAAAAVAESLRGVGRAAVWAESTLETCVAVVGGLTAGVDLVPLNPKLGISELAHIIGDSQPEVVLGAPEGASTPRRRPRRSRPSTSTPRAARCPPTKRSTTTPPRSSSTRRGRPAARRARSCRAARSPRTSTRSPTPGTGPARTVLVHALPLFHVHGLVLGTLGPLRLGGHLRHLVRFDAATAAQALSDGGTMLFGVPTMYHRIAAEAEGDPDGRCGPARRAAARVRTPRRCRRRSSRASSGDRPAGGRALRPHRDAHEHRRARGRRRKPGYVGLPLPNVDLRVVLDEGGDLTDFDGETIGEVAVRGPNVFTGYLNRPDATAEAMRDGWFFTGDLATRTADGYVRIVGRRSTDLIKTGGYKVGAGEIEVALLEHPDVSRGGGHRRARRGPRGADHRLGRRGGHVRHARSQGPHQPRRPAARAAQAPA